MPLKLALVFHFNQSTNEQIRVADRTAYRGLFSVLRAHPGLKINLHLSGTLLRGLGWFSPETMDLLRAGLADGQFELLGSLYAQNVAYASDDQDNRLQLEVHRRVLKDVLGVEPRVFWNPERTWRDSLLPLIAGAGYEATLLEDRALRAAGVVTPMPVRLTGETGGLTAVCDDAGLRERLNWAVWYGRDGALWKYLDDAVEQAKSATHWLAYAEDAEAMGLWGWEAGYLPAAHWAALDTVLAELEKRALARELAIEHLSKARGRQEIKTVPDTAAGWMERALQNPEARYHEGGYTGYFDFAARSPKLNYFRKLYSVVRASFADTASPLATPLDAPPVEPAPIEDRFVALADEVYAAHQYEFGCVGVGGREYWAWENVRNTFLYLRLAQLAADPTPRRWIEDLNGDGNDEQIWCDGRQLVMLTGYGGRLLGWFDLKNRAVWVGNPLAIPRARYVDGASAHPKLRSDEPRWLPTSAAWDLKPFKAWREKEPAPARLAREVDLSGFPREPETYAVYRYPTEGAEALPAVNIQHAALNDWWSLDGEERPASTFIDYRFEDDEITYVNAIIPDLVIHKQIALIPHGIRVSYRAQNRTGRRRILGWRLAHELNPGYAEVLAHGRGALAPLEDSSGIAGVVNQVTKQAVQVTCSRAWTSTGWSEGLLALVIEGALSLEIPARGTLSWQVELKAH
ncbi:MAG: hypothetical protein JNL73_02255 [Anaerolineales bacterium]|nr:hypothetical protein [Anaerolineales bacterium]